MTAFEQLGKVPMPRRQPPSRKGSTLLAQLLVEERADAGGMSYREQTLRFRRQLIIRTLRDCDEDLARACQRLQVPPETLLYYGRGGRS